MKHTKLTKEEKAIEDKLEEYISVNKAEFKAIANAVAIKRKDAVLNIRVNSQDLERIKKKASKLGIKYQSFIGEILHKIAQT